MSTLSIAIVGARVRDCEPARSDGSWGTGGSRKVTFKKVPDHFAARLKQGRATDEAVLAAATGWPRAKLAHVESVAPDNLEVFAVEEASELEATMDEMREAPFIEKNDNYPDSENT